MLPTCVSNGTGQCNFSGQRDNGTSSKSCTGRDETACQHSGRDTGQSLFFCQDPGRDAGRDGPTLFFFPMIFFFRTYFPVLERLFPFFFGGGEGFCPGIFAPAFVPGQRDNGTSRPGLSRDVPRDVLSLGNATTHPILYERQKKPKIKSLNKIGTITIYSPTV